MEQQVQKKEVILNNESYKERFQFIFSLNENIICQRYFRINGFNADSIESVELRDTIDEIVTMLKNDLVSKSRAYMWYTRETPLKLTGFGASWLDDAYVKEKSGEATFFEYPPEIVDTYGDTEKPQPYEFTFKFEFVMDDKPVYQCIWDGGVYPRYVRNSVDLSNSNHLYRERDILSLPFSVAVIRAMTIDKPDLIYTIIRKICDVTSMTYTEKYGNYVKREKYGDKKYMYSLYNEQVVNNYKEALKQKSRDYFSNLFPSQKEIEYIDNRL